MVGQAEFLANIMSIADEIPIVINNKKTSYYNIPASFDIEVSSFYQDGQKKAVMYVWQFGILNWVTYGRTWSEYKAFIKILSKILYLSSDLFLVVYVHNLPYEFQFMRKQFEWDKIFFLEERKPVYAQSSGLEYRCSLKLSSKSLENTAKDLQRYKVSKLVGDLDYSLIRTPETPLTQQELKYCENDIRVVLAYIQEKIENDGGIHLIPLTNTGYVRNFCRKACFQKYRKYRGLMESLTLESDEYLQLKRAFQGGFTHASAKYSGKVLSNVGSFDFTSSYPAVMVSEKFPMSKGTLVNSTLTEDELKNYLYKYCCLIDITFIGLTPRLDYDHPISKSKLIKGMSEGISTDNGRVVSAMKATLTCTEQDFFTYARFYQWDEMVVHSLRYYRKAYLPTPFVKAILSMYKDKTTLKGVEGQELNYMISKNMLNSAYGMTVTDIVRPTISYQNGEFTKEVPNLDKEIGKYNISKRRFIYFPWGVWVTSYARSNLFSGIIACGNDYIYSDTDSIKVLHPDSHMDYIKRYNASISTRLAKAAEFHNISIDEFSPKNKKGEAKPLGVWDYEGTYDEFKTIGAKRYFVRIGDNYSITVAGLSKSKARDYIVSNWENPMDALADGMYIPPENSGRLTLTYVDEPCEGFVRDYRGRVSEYGELSYIHMEPSEYRLTLSDEYKSFLNTLYQIREDSW